MIVSKLRGTRFVILCYFVGVAVGFASELVSVSENGGNAELKLVLTGSLERDVIITLTTAPITATSILNLIFNSPNITFVCMQLLVTTLQHHSS